MPRRVALLVTWLLATAAATALAWGGVQIVAGRVVDPMDPLSVASAGLESSADAAAGPETPTAVLTPGIPPPPASSTTGPASPPPGRTRSYDLVGGTVTVRFSPTRVQVVTASPKDGFVLRSVEREGPTDVEIEFRRADDTWRSELRATWDEGPADRIEERDRT